MCWIVNTEGRSEHCLVHWNISFLHGLSHVALTQHLIIFDLLLSF